MPPERRPGERGRPREGRGRTPRLPRHPAAPAGPPPIAERAFVLPDRAAELLVYGEQDRNLRALREAFGVRGTGRDGRLLLVGSPEAVALAAVVCERLLRRAETGRGATPDEVQAWIREARTPAPAPPASATGAGGPPMVHPPLAEPKTAGQAAYLDAMRAHDLVFALGPAGTGKTYLAVAAGVAALRAGECRRLVLTRPAVEAGEHLGFLPGDYHAKVNPYLRPLYDALGDFLPPGEVGRNVERDVFEIAPLAYMRGRTLNDSMVILDEGQNTTITQMKMFLTRLGARSRAVITGDPTQVDLPSGVPSGLSHAARLLEGIPGVGIVRLTRADIVRHRLLAAIIDAYEGDEPKRRRPRGRTR